MFIVLYVLGEDATRQSELGYEAWSILCVLHPEYPSCESFQGQEWGQCGTSWLCLSGCLQGTAWRCLRAGCWPLHLPGAASKGLPAHLEGSIAAALSTQRHRQPPLPDSCELPRLMLHDRSDVSQGFHLHYIAVSNRWDRKINI